MWPKINLRNLKINLRNLKHFEILLLRIHVCSLCLQLMGGAWITWWHCLISLNWSSQPETGEKSLYWKSASHLQISSIWCCGKGFRKRSPLSSVDVNRTVTNRALSTESHCPSTSQGGSSGALGLVGTVCGAGPSYSRIWKNLAQKLSHMCYPQSLQYSVTLETSEGNLIRDILK